MKGDLGVYFHIPFCRSKCAYCDFCSTARWDDKLLDAYLAALTDQLGDFFLPGGRYSVDTVYIGGGTPSVLGGKRLARLLKALEKRAALTRACEITVEVNPESAGKALFKALKSAGVNRISMGVQSADDRLLKRIGRAHDFAKAREAVELCKAYCTENLSLDLIYCLPGQTMDSWLESLEAICALEPRHISCYALKLEEGTPLWREGPVVPDDDLQADMYLAAVEALEGKGYPQYEISNFARRGFRSRHNSRYWDLSEYLGFGCAAHSFYGGKRFSFTDDIDAYIKGRKGRSPILEEADEQAFDDRVGEYVMLALRTTDGIGENAFYSRWRREFTPFARQLEPFIQTGHVRKDAGRWHLTPKGFLVSNAIIGAALDGLCQQTGKGRATS